MSNTFCVFSCPRKEVIRISTSHPCSYSATHKHFGTRCRKKSSSLIFYGCGYWKRFRRLVPTRAAVTRTIWMSQYDTKSRSPHEKSFSRRRVAGPQPTEAQMLIQWAYKRVQDERYPFECTSNRMASVTRGPLQVSPSILF